MKHKIEWSATARNDLQILNKFISANKVDAINAPNKIIFPEQFQIDSYRKDYGRIIEENHKILYQFKNNQVRIIKIFNSLSVQ